MLEKVLNDLGLGHKEQIIYKLILERGKIAPALLSRLSKINRTTVYSVAAELKEKGLIVEDLGGRTLYYLPVSDKELEKVLRKEEEKMLQKKNSILELQEFLRQVPQSKTFSIPKIRFVDEIDLEKYLYEATPRWIQSSEATNKIWWAFQDHTFPAKFENYIDWTWELELEKKMEVKVLTNESKSEENLDKKYYSKNRHKKYLPDSELNISQWVVGNYIIYVMTRERPYYLVEIHDSVIAHNTASLFKRIWEGL